MARPRKTKNGVRIDPKTGKAETGRPTKFTKATIAKLEQAFSFGCTDSEACLYADLHVSTLYKYQIENPEFVDRKNALKATPILIARESLIKGVKNDPVLALKFLERKLKDEFGLRSELTGPNGSPLMPGIDLSQLSAKQLDKLRDIAATAQSRVTGS